jgi:type I restriction enzyme, S subunit
VSNNNSWQKVRLGDLVENLTTNEYEPLENGLTKYVAGNHLESKKLHITKFGDLKTDKEVIGPAFHRKFLSGDVLFGSRRAYLRKTGIATFDGLCSNTTLVIRKKSDELVDGILPFIFRLEKFTEHAVKKSTGSVTPYILWRNLADFIFELPPKHEQLKLKEFLWTLQNSIDKLENLIEKTKNYMVSRRESLLTRGIGHTKFKKVPWLFGKEIEIPQEWDWQQISNNSTLKGRIGWQGLTTREYRQEGKFYLVTGTDFKNGRIDWDNCVYVDEIRYKQDTNIQLKNNDVLITKDGTIGKIAYVDSLSIPSTLNTGVFVVRPMDGKYIPLFFYHVLFSDYFIKFLDKLKAGTTINHLYQKDFNTFYFPLPPLPEQQKIISILSNINKQITQQKSHLTNLYTLQDSILNSKLTKEKVIAQ